MDIEISKVEFQEPERRILVTVSYREQQPNRVWYSANVTVFVDWLDSYTEVTTAAKAKALEFLKKLTP